MSAVATKPRPGTGTAPALGAGAEPRLFETGEVTLEERVLGLLEGIERDGHAGCPVCGGRLERGGCQGCGSELG